MMASKQPTLQYGVIIKGKWKVLKKIGQGAFGEIFCGKNIMTGDGVAIKIEKVDSDKPVLKMEVAVLKKLQSSSPWVVPFVACGRHQDFNFLVMELLGDNLAELRRLKQGRFSMTTTLKLGIQMIKGLESVHESGYLHRDVKPSNFAMGLLAKKKQTCFIIDFGLARRYLLSDGEVRPARECAGFRGTARYASTHSHQSRDLGRRDDLWSILYLLIEFALGQLPWRKLKDKDLVGKMKIKCNNDELVAGLPPEFLQFMKHLMELQYASRPNYSFLINMFEDLYKRMGGTDKMPFDWEIPQPSAVRQSRPLPSLIDLAFVSLLTGKGMDQKWIMADKFAQLDSKIRLKMFEFLLRLNEGDLPQWLIESLLDKSITILDLTRSKIPAERLFAIAKLVGDLEVLKLGPTSDEVLKEFVERSPSLQELEMVGTRNLTEKGLKVLSSVPNLSSLTLKDSDRITDKGVEQVLRQCSKISHLGVTNCKKVKGSALKVFTGEKGAIRSKKPVANQLTSVDLSGCSVSKSGIKKLAKLGPNLQSLSLNDLSLKAIELGGLISLCPSLKRLELGSDGNESFDEAFNQAGQHCRGLEHLKMSSRQLTEQVVADVLKRCSRLKSVTISQGADNGFAATSLPRTLGNLSTLEKVQVKFGKPIYKHTSISDSALRLFLQSSAGLRYLGLTECLVLSVQCFPDNYFYPNLRTLDLSFCPQIQDEIIQKITENAPFLTRLCINNLNLISQASLESISQNCRLLQEVEMKGCVCFPDSDLKAFLRKLPLTFLMVTRYTKRDTIGIEKEVHFSNADDVFLHYPNSHRDYVFANQS